MDDQSYDNLNTTLETPEFIITTSEKTKYLFLLAHGAGAGMNHQFMQGISDAIASLNGMVIRFNFPYITQGKKLPGSPKDALKAIDQIYAYAQKEFSNLPIFLGGKSYGGRMSSHWIIENLESAVKGIVYLGFPLHAPGKSSSKKAMHLSAIIRPQFFLQGTRDQLASYPLIKEVIGQQQKATLYTVVDGDHSFKVPKKSGKTQAETIKEIAQEINLWAIQNS